MALQLGDTAPDFEAETTEGHIKFHDWLGDSWAVLFSHPRNFTPVCTTELGYMASIEPEFAKRGVKIIGLSVDPVENHEQWAKDIEETQGTAPNYPLIGDSDFNVSKLYGMLPRDVSGDPTSRTPADNQTVRNVFVIGPDKKVKLILVYPMTTGPQLRRGAARDRLAAADGQAQGRDARELAEGRRRHHRRLGLRRGREGAVPRGLEVAQAVHPDRPGPQQQELTPGWPAVSRRARSCSRSGCRPRDRGSVRAGRGSAGRRRTPWARAGYERSGDETLDVLRALEVARAASGLAADAPARGETLGEWLASGGRRFVR